MLDLLTFWVPGEPRSKGRPRFSRGEYGSVHVYSDSATKEGETAIANCAIFASPFLEPSEAPIKVEATFYLYRRNRRDLDNMVKLVLDALNGVAWIDDEQVVSLSAVKKRSEDREGAGTSIRVSAFPGDDHSHWPIVLPSEKKPQSTRAKSPKANTSDQQAARGLSPSMRNKILRTVEDNEGLEPSALAAFLGLPVGVIVSVLSQGSD